MQGAACVCNSGGDAWTFWISSEEGEVDKRNRVWCAKLVKIGRCFLIAFLSVFSINAGAAEGGRLIEITQAVWTNDVNRETKNHGGSIDNSPSDKPLYLWLRVRGGKAALDKLESDGLLPIRHKWFKNTITGTTAGGVLRGTDEIDVPAAKKEASSRLREVVEQQKYFLWRTWSKKERVGKGRWVVKVVYADNSPVLCEKSKPCEYAIEVK